MVSTNPGLTQAVWISQLQPPKQVEQVQQVPPSNQRDHCLLFTAQCYLTSLFCL